MIEEKRVKHLLTKQRKLQPLWGMLYVQLHSDSKLAHSTEHKADQNSYSRLLLFLMNFRS
jgi:hypothetical protein